MENETIRILLERQKEQILPDCRAEINTNLKPILTGEVYVYVYEVLETANVAKKTL